MPARSSELASMLPVNIAVSYSHLYRAFMAFQAPPSALACPAS